MNTPGQNGNQSLSGHLHFSDAASLKSRKMQFCKSVENFIYAKDKL